MENLHSVLTTLNRQLKSARKSADDAVTQEYMAYCRGSVASIHQSIRAVHDAIEINNRIRNEYAPKS